jgi:hypothetical protein
MPEETGSACAPERAGQWPAAAEDLTGLLVVAMTTLAGIFIGIAAGTTAGRKLIQGGGGSGIEEGGPSE